MTAAAPQPGAILALDPGTVRVGVAASVPGSTMAVPVGSFPRDPASLWPRLQREVRDRGVSRIVVGLPRRLDGGEGDAAAAARSFAAEVEARTGVPCDLWDERFTSAQAERELIAAGVRRARRRDTVDAAAATLLLQSWIDSPRTQGR